MGRLNDKPVFFKERGQGVGGWVWCGGGSSITGELSVNREQMESESWKQE